MKVAAIIPARLASSRFPRKVLVDFCNMPMVEHVRARAEMSGIFNAGVYVATCDQEIHELIVKNGGLSILTSEKHHSGTSRSAEAIKGIDCSHAVIIQGDEPLILPEQLQRFVNTMKNHREFDAWNGVSDIENTQDMSDQSIVKCVVNELKRIIFCFRGNPFVSDFGVYQGFTKKMLGLIGFKKATLEGLNMQDQGPVEKEENIEQLQLVCAGYKVYSVNLGASLPSVNLLKDAEKVAHEMATSQVQIDIMKQYIL